jgi:hypothetical protein
MIRHILVALVITLTGVSLVLAQGTQTATIAGSVLDPDGLPLSGVTVRATAPNQMGERESLTQSQGDYVLRGLAPGSYTVRFSREGFQAVSVELLAPLGGVARADARMGLSATSEAITVRSESRPALETSTVGQNLTREIVRLLPVSRTPLGIATLVAGVVADRGGTAGQPVIHGAFAYDSAIMVNGVNVQDPVGGFANTIFIEDTILETQVLTSGIGAEYGHFTGGVLNLITRTGGNDFNGSVRADFDKPEWRDETPFEKGFRGDGVTRATPVPREGDLGEVYTATLGGPLFYDRLWFFGAVRDQKNTSTPSLSLSATLIPRVITNRRIEGKLSASLTPNHSFQASYIESPIAISHDINVNPLTIHAVARNTKRLQEGTVYTYSGVLTQSLFAEARYSEKVWALPGLGGTSRDIVDSPFRSTTRFPGVIVGGGTFNAPYFDATDPEERNNEQIFGALSWFTTAGAGSHDVKGGVERFTVTRRGGNSQSSTNYVFYTGYQVLNGVPQYDGGGSLIPVFNPRQPGRDDDTRIGYWVASRGATLDIKTDSFFLQDRWDLNARWSVSLGVRHERVRSEATGGIEAVDTDATVPRMGVTFDPSGSGRFKLDATYAEYAGAYNPGWVGANSGVGSPNFLYGFYTGPAGVGRNFAPGFDISNYTFYYARVPTGNVFVGDGLSAPINQEISLSAGAALPGGGWLKATFVERRLKNMIEDFTTIDQGCTQIVFEGVNAGCFDNRVLRNSSIPERNYRALQLHATHSLTRSWTVAGNYTHQLRNHGTTEGTASAIGDRPEVQSPREFPYGRLALFQAHKVRLWSTYTLGLGRAGTFSSGLVYRYDSPEVFSYVTPGLARTAIQRGRNPGYKAVPTQGIYYGERGAGEFNASSLFDLSLSYAIPVIWRIEPWFKFDVLNVLNDDTQMRWNTTVTPDAGSALDENGLRTGYVKAAAFGRPRSATDYVVPREYFISAGIRF